MLREEVETEVIATPEHPAPGEKPKPLNPFALGLPFLVIGVLLMPLFSIVGLAISAIGAFMCVVGVAMAIFNSRSRAREEGE